VKLGCGTGSGGCTGTLRLQLPSKGRTRTVGSARYRLAAGRAGSVRIRLTRSALRTLKRRGSLRVSAVAKSSAGTVQRSLVIRAAR
jgi:hypothetical protein